MTRSRGRLGEETTTDMDPSRCDRVIQFALLEAGRQDDYGDRELGPIHLLKYVYLADLAHAEKNQGESFTGTDWCFYHYGPWATDLHGRIEPALEAIQAQRKVVQSNRYDNDFIRWVLTDDELHASLEKELPRAVTSAIRKYVRKFGKDTGELLNFVYTTRPMRGAAPGEPLVLFVAEDVELPTYAVSESTSLTARQEKKRTERIGKAKQDIKAKLAARRAARELRKTVNQPPRYDEIYQQGLQWLDELTGSPEGEVHGEAHFDDTVWKSDTRGEERD